MVCSQLTSQPRAKFNPNLMRFRLQIAQIHNSSQNEKMLSLCVLSTNLFKGECFMDNTKAGFCNGIIIIIK